MQIHPQDQIVLDHVAARGDAIVARAVGWANVNSGSRNAAETSFCYDKLRTAELRRTPWRFATRRANLRPITSTSYRFIPGSWAVGTTYAAGAIVMDTSGVYWISNVGTNLGNVPGTPVVGYPPYWSQYFGNVIADIWSNAVVYDAGEVVYKSGRTYYIATANAIAAATDPASGAPWVPITTVTADQLVALLSPAGPGKTVAGRARSLFPLPNGYLRVLSPDPKVESTSTLSTSAGLPFLDWQFEGNYIVTAAVSPLLLRFVADVSDVPSMDSLFCEGLACRIAYEVCEILTQSNVKLQAIGAAYQKFVRDARLINWLEIGSTEPQEEEYELTRGPQGVTEAQPPQPQGQQQGV